MDPSQPLKDERQITYFVPDTFILTVSHPRDMPPEQVVERLAETPVGRENKVLNESLRYLARMVQKQERLPLRYEPSSRFWDEERENMPPMRGTDQTPEAISLVFADMPMSADKRFKQTEGPSYVNDEAILLEKKNRLIALINDVNRRLEDPNDDGEVILQAIVPSWFCNSTPKVIGTGGPGARPVAAPSLDQQWWGSTVDDSGTPFAFHSATLARLDDRRGEHQHVEVAILDTAPSKKQLTTAYDRWNKQHPLLRSLLEPNGDDERRLHCSYAADFLAGTGIELPDDTGIRGHEYTMEDHGLFAAGIVHTLAPTADLHLVEVLNPFGVGSLETIARGVEVALKGRRDPKAALILNCSLMLSLPRPASAGRSGHPAPNFPWKITDDSLLRAWVFPLRLVCDRVLSEGGIITAAAGNDANPKTEASGVPRPAARYPAAFGRVIGVGALTADAKPAEYSNFSDEPISKGIVTFGGGVASNGTGVLDTSVALTADTERGILGVYTGKLPDPTAMLPEDRGAYPDPRPNESGWARWAGTSFATPIISGALARTIGNGTPPTEAEQELRRVEEAASGLGEETFTVKQG